MGLVIEPNNLWLLALPALICACLSAIFTLLLWRAAWVSGLPHRREPCVTCVFEADLLRKGTCTENCAINSIPTLPLMLFFITSGLTMMCVFFPSLVSTYVIPFNLAPPLLPTLLLVTLGATNGGAAVLLATYFVQDRAWHRELFFRGAAAMTLIGLIAASTLAGLGKAGWITSSWLQTAAVEAEWLTPLGLFAIIVVVAMEHRARLERPVMGLRGLGLTTAPIFLIVVIGLARMLEILSYAYPQLV